MKKKYIIFLLVIAITVALSGCGSASNEVSGENFESEAEASIAEESTPVEAVPEEPQEETVQEEAVQEAPEVEADRYI